MASFNVTEAALSGFGVIKRNPIAPAVWGLVQIALVAVPLAMMLPAMLDFFRLAAESSQSGAEPTIKEIWALQSRMMLASPLSWLGQLVGTGLIMGAIFRAVLSPADKGWFFMRVGMAEVMLVAVSIVFKILLGVAVAIGAIVAVLLGFAVGQASQGAGVLVGILAGLAVVGTAIWAGLRLSLSLPMSFEQKTFLLFESWGVTRGQAGGLFLMALLNIILVFLIESLVTGLVFGLVAVSLVGTGVLDLTAVEDPDFFTPARLQGLIPWGIGLLAISGILSGYLMTLMTAPWAAAYRALRPEAAPE